MPSRSNPANGALSQFLYASRWLSAILVVFVHLNNRFFLRLGLVPVELRTAPVYVWNFFCGFGHQAVIVFFVLSGFLVGGKLAGQFLSGMKIDYPRYLIDRFVRIYLVLVPALLIGFILDGFGSKVFPQASAYLGLHQGRQSLSFLTFIGNILGLQNFFVATYGTNGPIGTLAIEWWYYLCFPLLLTALQVQRRFRWVRLALFIIIVTVLTWREGFFGVGFVIWGLGALAATVKTRLRLSPRVACSVFLVGIVAERLLIRGESVDTWFYSATLDCFVAVLFTLAIISLRQSTLPTWKWLKPSIHEKLAGFSYSLYAIHAVVLTFFAAWCETYLHFGASTIPSSPLTWVCIVIVLGITIACGWLLGQITEHYTHPVRAWAYRTLEKLEAPVCS
jgi:peptidoglycan/LPS O-acetylase OafA/YrhL